MDAAGWIIIAIIIIVVIAVVAWILYRYFNRNRNGTNGTNGTNGNNGNNGNNGKPVTDAFVRSYNNLQQEIRLANVQINTLTSELDRLKSSSSCFTALSRASILNDFNAYALNYTRFETEAAKTASELFSDSAAKLLSDIEESLSSFTSARSKLDNPNLLFTCGANNYAEFIKQYAVVDGHLKTLEGIANTMVRESS